MCQAVHRDQMCTAATWGSLQNSMEYSHGPARYWRHSDKCSGPASKCCLAAKWKHPIRIFFFNMVTSVILPFPFRIKFVRSHCLSRDQLYMGLYFVLDLYIFLIVLMFSCVDRGLKDQNQLLIFGICWDRIGGLLLMWFFFLSSEYTVGERVSYCLLGNNIKQWGEKEKRDMG